MAPTSANSHESKPRVRTGILELVVVIFYAGLVSYYPTIQQYVFKRCLEDSRTVGTAGETAWGNGTDSGKVCYNGTNDGREAAAQSLSAEWLLYIGLSNAVPGIFSTLVIGAITDVRGRKLGMIIPAVGAIIKVALTMLVIKFNWPIAILLVGGFIDGCMGSFGTTFMAAFSYLADITKAGESRTLRITILQALMGIVASGVSLGTGYFIRATGYFYPMLAGLILFVIAIVLVVFCLPETIEPSDQQIFGCSRLTSSVKIYIRQREGSKRAQLLLLLVSYLLLEMVLIGKGVLCTLFQMGYPFCWQSVKLGICTAIGTTVQVSSMLILLKPLTKCFHENVIGIFGMISAIGELLMTGFAISDVMLFLAPVVGFFILMPAAMIKSVASILVGPQEQGSLFAGISSIQMLCFTFGSSMFNSVYASTVSSFPGLVFLLMAAILLITFILFCTVEILRRKFDDIVMFEPIPATSGDDEDDDDDGDIGSGRP